MPEKLPVLDPTWIDEIARGCRVVTWCIYTLLATFSLCVFLCIPAMMKPRTPVYADRLFQGWLVLGALCVLGAMAGLWVATKPHDASERRDSMRNQRVAVRIGLLLVPVTVGLSWYLARSRPVVACLIPMFLGSPTGVAGLVGAWSFTKYIQGIGHSIGDSKSTRSAPRCRAGFTFAWIMAWTGAGGSWFRAGWGFDLVLVVGCLLLLVFTPLSVGLAAYLYEALPAYLMAAKAVWEKADLEANS